MPRCGANGPCSPKIRKARTSSRGGNDTGGPDHTGAMSKSESFVQYKCSVTYRRLPARVIKKCREARRLREVAPYVRPMRVHMRVFRSAGPRLGFKRQHERQGRGLRRAEGLLGVYIALPYADDFDTMQKAGEVRLSHAAKDLERVCYITRSSCSKSPSICPCSFAYPPTARIQTSSLELVECMNFRPAGETAFA